MSNQNTTGLERILKQVPTPQLDDMLHSELSQKPVDENTVRLILHILKEREADYPEEITQEVNSAWEKYQREAEKSTEKESGSGRVRSWAIRVAAVAAILCLVIAVVPQEAGAQSFLERLMRWTESIVEFFSQSDNEGRFEEYEFTTDNPGLQQVYDAVVELGITEPVVPMWLPEGCELNDCSSTVTPRKSGVIASFMDGAQEVVLLINTHAADVSHEYYKDETIVETYEMQGFIHTIMRNNEKWIAIWSKDNIECSIFIDCQEETLNRILKSIYVNGG